MKLALTLATIALVAAQPLPERTSGKLNCRGWKLLDLSAKGAFLIGFAEGLYEPPVKQLDYEFIAKYIPKSSLSPREIAVGIDSFCATAENQNVMASDAMKIVAMKADGAEPSQIDEKAAGFRRVARLLIEGESKR